MKIQTTAWMRSAFCGFAGLAIAFSAAVATAQEEGGRRRGRAEVQEGDAPGQPGGPRGQRGGPGGQRGGPGGPGGRGPGGSGGPEMMMRLPIIAALDVDRDGVISAKEIEGAVAALKKLDKNNDGKLVFQELVPGRGGPGGQPGGQPGRGPRGFGPGGDRPGGPDQAGRGPGGFGGMDPKAMVDRMMQADKDGDGVLSGDEIPERMARMLERGDSDGDGKLSRAEIEKAMSRMQRGGGRPDGGRPGAGRDSDTPGGEKPRRPAAE